MSGITMLPHWLDNGTELTSKNNRNTWLGDDRYYLGGNAATTPDWRLGWNTAQTVDGLYLGLSDAQNTFIIAENGDRAFDFAHGAAINPTVFVHSAAQSTTQYISLTHDQTNAVILAGAGALVVNATALLPDANDAYALGAAGTAFSDLFLAEGGVINWDSSDATITQTGDTLAFAGVTLFDMATGILEMNDAVRFDTGVAMVAASYSVGRDADVTNQLHFNVPTGATFEWSANDTQIVTLSLTQLNFPAQAGAGTDSVSIALGGRTSVGSQEVVLLTEADAATDTYRLRINRTSSVQMLAIESNGQVLGNNGAVGTPTYSFAASTNDGFYTTGATSVSLALGGVERYTMAAATFTVTGTNFTINQNSQNILRTNSGGETVFNETQIDVDFRIESDNLPNIFHVDAALDVIGIGAAGVDNQFVTITERAESSGAPSAIVVVGAAHTGITAATEAIGLNFNQSATKTWAAGAGPLALQREVLFQAPTYVGNAGGALTITEAATVAITGAPTQGANMTLSETHALLVMAGSSAFGGNVQPRTTDGAALGTTAIMWSDLFLATGAVINWNNGDITLTGTDANNLNLVGAVFTTDSAIRINTVVSLEAAEDAIQLANNWDIQWSSTAAFSGAKDLGLLRSAAGVLAVTNGGAGSGSIVPQVNDGGSLGISGTAWSDLFLASGGVINFLAGDVTMTHSANLLTLAGGDLAMGNDVLIRRDVNAGLTASVTQTQGNGPLTAEVNEVATVANVNDTVTLPSAVTGYRVVIINNGANTLQIFPASGDNLGAGIDTATTLAAGSNVVYQSYNVTNWESI